MHNDIIPQDGQDVAACVGTYLVLLHLVTYFFAFFLLFFAPVDSC